MTCSTILGGIMLYYISQWLKYPLTQIFETNVGLTLENFG